MANYAKPLPIDKAGNSMHELPPPFRAIARTNTPNAVASSVISLNGDTSSIEVGAFGGQGIVIRWVPTTEIAYASSVWSASIISSGVGANFDHWIAPSTYRRFVLPKETGGAPAGGVGSINGLYQRVAVINAGATASSMLMSEL
jgi:hypothetical protein